MEVFTILWREFIFFKKRALKITSATIITPILYLIAFGWGLEGNIKIQGYSYISFLIPGIIALSSMRTSFNAVSIRITVSRFTEKSFEYYLTAPINLYLLTLGQILAGALRGFYASILIYIVTLLFKQNLNVNIYFWIIVFLNSILFSALGYFAAMVIESHYEMNRFTSFVITPMSFLCGTFFSLDKMPIVIKNIISFLPLSFTTQALRNIAVFDKILFKNIFFLLLYIVVFYILSVRVSYREV